MNLTITDKLARGTTVVGTWITLPSTALTEIAGRAGFDWVAVDLEHSTLTDADFERHARVADGLNVACFARLPSVDPHRIKRLLDAGAAGLIIANVTSVEQVDAAFQAMRYPPEGTRGVGLGRAHQYGAGFSRYVEEHKDATLVVQIENISALPNLAGILSHPGVAAWMLGPYDLSASVGYPGDFQHPDVQHAVQIIQTEAKHHKAAPGIHVVEPDPQELRLRINEGYRFVAYTVDFRVLDVSYREGVVVAARAQSSDVEHE